MIVLGLDPSMTGFGYSVIDTESTPVFRASLLGAGVWETWPDRTTKSVTEDNAERFAYLSEQLWTKAMAVKPERVYVEGSVFIPGKMTAASIHALGRVRGFVDVVGAGLGVEVVELAPSTVKKGLVIIQKRGQGLASKEEVREAVCRLYENAVDLIPKGKVGDNAADAIAVAHVGLTKQAFRDRLKSGSDW